MRNSRSVFDRGPVARNRRESGSREKRCFLPSPSHAFTVADLDARGELLLKEAYRYAPLELLPAAPEFIGQFSGELWRSFEAFEAPIDGFPALVLRWRATCPTAGVATLRHRGEIVWLSLLVSGLNAADDRITLETFQRHLVRELHGTPYEPAFTLLDLTERPLIATFNFRSPAAPPEQTVAALLDRCFAAAFFRRVGLA